jgi:DNA-binding transcriptional regulator YiaG
MSAADEKRLRDARFLAGLGDGAELELDPDRVATVLLSERRGLGKAIQAGRDLARISRADLARALGVDEQRVADIESGSVPIERRR